jgi:hypothetical protein
VEVTDSSKYSSLLRYGHKSFIVHGPRVFPKRKSTHLLLKVFWILLEHYINLQIKDCLQKLLNVQALPGLAWGLWM